MIDLIARKLALQASTNASTALTAISSRAPNLSVLGAIGDGTSPGSDQTGFEGVISAITASLSAAPTGSLDYAQYQTGAMIEPGIYDAGGLTQAAGNVRLVARVPGTVIIRIPAGQFFMTISGKVNAVLVDGISFVGGKGAFNFTNTGENVSLKHSFTRNFFCNYTGCAIQNAAIDHPYLIVRDNVFLGDIGSSTIGVAWGGYTDQLLIENNTFLANAYHLKIGSYGQSLSTTSVIRHNDFISFFGSASPNQVQSDIWLVPCTQANGISAGFASKISENKFGNENHNPASPRILIAPENTAIGTDRGSYRPATTSGGYLAQLIIADNLFSGAGVSTAPVIRSTIVELWCIEWRSNKFIGSPYAYVIEHTNRTAANSYETNTNSDFTFTEADVCTPGYPANLFSNIPFGRLHDFAGFFPGDPNAVDTYPASDNPALSLITNGVSPAARAAFGGAAKANTTDQSGGTSYDLATVTAANQGVSMYLDTIGMGAGGMVFIELALQQAPSRSLSQVTIDLRNDSSGAYALRRTVSLPASAGRLKLPVFLPSQSYPQGWQLRVYATGTVTAGTADQFITGDWIVNTGATPIGRDRALARYPVMPRNRSMQATAAAPAYPLGWSFIGISGLVATVATVGTDANGAYLDLALSGTTTAAGTASLYFESMHKVEAAVGQIWQNYAPVILKAGNLANFADNSGTDGSTGKLALCVQEFYANGAYAAQLQTAFSPSVTYAKYGRSDWGAGSLPFTATMSEIKPFLSFTIGNGVTVNATLRVYVPTLQRLR